MTGTTLPAKMWRKNRRANPNGSFGVDLCRNFGSPGWTNVNPQTGQPWGMADQVYPGPNAFSESETLSLSQYMLGKNNIVYAIDVHSFASKVLYGNCEDASIHQNNVLQADLTPFTQSLGYVLQQAFGFYAPNIPIIGTTVEWWNRVYQQNCYGAVIELEANGSTNSLTGFCPPPGLNIVPVGTKVYNALVQLMLNGSKFP